MEALIFICLLIIIILLLQDRFSFRKKDKDVKIEHSVKSTSSFIGKPKSSARRLELETTNQKLNVELDTDETKPQHEIHIHKKDIQIPTKNLEEIFASPTNLEEEEEAWSSEQIFDDNELASGVTFEELGEVEEFLKNEKTDIEHGEKAVEILKKIQGTELFSLFENSFKESSEKISTLLESTLLLRKNSDSTQNDVNDFDIEAFV